MENQEYTYIIVDDEGVKEEALLNLNDYYDSSVFYDFKSYMPAGDGFLYDIIADSKQEDEKDTCYTIDYSYL